MDKLLIGVGAFLFGLVLAVIGYAFGAVFVMLGWHLFAVPYAGAKMLAFWEAFGLVMLSGSLFGKTLSIKK